MARLTEKIAYVAEEPSARDERVDLFSPADFDPEQLREHRAIVLRYSKNLTCTIAKIKGHPDPTIYCKPLFLEKDDPGETAAYDTECLDGIYGGRDIPGYCRERKDDIDRINSRIAEMRANETPHPSSSYDLALKVIRYLYSRDKPLNPVRCHESIYGYLYPAVDMFFPKESYQEFILIDFLKNKNLVEGAFIDKIHLCNHCHSAYINFRETCPACSSADLNAEDLIHHFPCGYMGPDSDYISSQGMVCPKCNRLLKQLGVDYDRPSEVFICNQCSNILQEPAVHTLCIHCGKPSIPENLIHLKLYQYRLTALGISSAIDGVIYSIQEEYAKDLDMIDLSHFKAIVDLEIERIGKYGKSKSSVAVFTIDNYLDVMAYYGKKTTQLSRELARQVESVIEVPHAIAHQNDERLLFFLAELGKNDSDLIMKKLISNLKNILSENISIPLEFSYRIHEITGSESFDAILQAG